MPPWLCIRRFRLWLVVAAVCMCTGALGAASASAVTFSNPASIAIPVGPGTASPYPSTINVAGLGPSLEDVNLTLSGFSHTFPADVDVLLAGPRGQSVVLMSDVPRDFPPCDDNVLGANLTFDDAAASPIPLATDLISGTYRPTNNDLPFSGCGEVLDPFPAPAPGGPHGSTLAVFNGTDPNGTWSLYVFDDETPDSGSIANGWSLDLTSATASSGKPSNEFSFGKLKRNKKRGTATLAVIVPSAGTLDLSGKGVVKQRPLGPAHRVLAKTVSAAGTVKLKIKAKGKAKKHLDRIGTVKVKAKVTYTPTGGSPNTKTKRIKLIKRL
jgi:subtilisin-like proprotein convertase family protein